METTIKGGNLMVFAGQDVNGSLYQPKSIPLATSHTLRISAETEDVSHKDLSSSLWAANDVGKYSWEATTDNLYSNNGIDWLFECMTAQYKMRVYFAPKTEADGTALPSGGSWTPDTDAGFEGWAYITSLEVTAQNGENATFSATFTGIGELESNYPTT